MKSIYLFVLFLFVGCGAAPSHKDTVHQNDAFKKKNVTFNKNADYFNVKVKPTEEALVDESIFRLDRGDLAGVNKQDIVNAVIVECYKRNIRAGLEIAKNHTNDYLKFPSFWNQIGTCYLLNNEERKALLYYNKSLELLPSYSPALNNIGVIYTKKGQFQKALLAFQKALNSSRFSKTPRFNMAQLYLSFGLASESISLFQGLLGHSPNDVEVLSGLANANFMLGETSRSYELFHKIPDNFRSRPDVGINYARAALKLGKKDEAKTIFSKVSNTSPVYKNYYEESRNLIEGR